RMLYALKRPPPYLTAEHGVDVVFHVNWATQALLQVLPDGNGSGCTGVVTAFGLRASVALTVFAAGSLLAVQDAGGVSPQARRQRHGAALRVRDTGHTDAYAHNLAYINARLVQQL